MNTKKLLVAYDESKPNGGRGDFLAVVFETNTPIFLGLRSRRIYTSGRMVYIGREITEKDVFAKLVDTGRKIESVEQTLRTLENYIQKLQEFRIGNLLSVEADAASGFRLVKLADSPPTTNITRLP